MTASLAATVLGTPDPPALADFYRELLGWIETSREPGGFGFATLTTNAPD